MKERRAKCNQWGTRIYIYILRTRPFFVTVSRLNEAFDIIAPLSGTVFLLSGPASFPPFRPTLKQSRKTKIGSWNFKGFILVIRKRIDHFFSEEMIHILIFCWYFDMQFSHRDLLVLKRVFTISFLFTFLTIRTTWKCRCGTCLSVFLIFVDKRKTVFLTRQNGRKQISTHWNVIARNCRALEAFEVKRYYFRLDRVKVNNKFYTYREHREDHYEKRKIKEYVTKVSICFISEAKEELFFDSTGWGELISSYWYVKEVNAKKLKDTRQEWCLSVFFILPKRRKLFLTWQSERKHFPSTETWKTLL